MLLFFIPEINNEAIKKNSKQMHMTHSHIIQFETRAIKWKRTNNKNVEEMKYYEEIIRIIYRYGKYY